MTIKDIISNLSENWKLDYTDTVIDTLITVFHRFPGEMPKTSNEGDKYIQDWIVNDHHKGILATSMFYLCKYFNLTPKHLSISVLGEIAGQQLIHNLPYNNDKVIREAKDILAKYEDIQMADSRTLKIQIGSIIVFLVYLGYSPFSCPFENLQQLLKEKIYEIENKLDEVIRDDISDDLIGFLIWCEKSAVHNPNVAPAIKRNERAKRLFQSSIVIDKPSLSKSAPTRQPKKRKKYYSWKDEITQYKKYLLNHKPIPQSVNTFIQKEMIGRNGNKYTPDQFKKLQKRLEKFRENWMKEHPENN